MIKAIDEMLQQWAADLHPPVECDMPAGRSMLGILMDTQGELIRSTVGKDLWSRSAEIELIINKRLPDDLARVAWVQYTDYDSPDSLKWQHCGCSRATYYRRLNLLHAAIADILIARRRGRAA